MSRLKHGLAVAAGMACLAGSPADASAADPPAVFEPVPWRALLPEDRDAGQELKSLGLALLGDDDPRARAALQRLKQSWGQVPVVPAMDGRRIRIAGYVVPLDASNARGLREFLLVPYFGACIHTPPPPPNQVIHVRLAAPGQGLQLMDPVAVGGTLRVQATDTDQGRAGYLLDAEFIAPNDAAGPADPTPVRLGSLTPLLAVIVPLALAALLLSGWAARERRRTPRELKLSARLRKQQRRSPHRVVAAARTRMTWPQRLAHLAQLGGGGKPRKGDSR